MMKYGEFHIYRVVVDEAGSRIEHYHSKGADWINADDWATVGDELSDELGIIKASIDGAAKTSLSKLKPEAG